MSPAEKKSKKYNRCPKFQTTLENGVERRRSYPFLHFRPPLFTIASIGTTAIFTEICRFFISFTRVSIKSWLTSLVKVNILPLDTKCLLTKIECSDPERSRARKIITKLIGGIYCTIKPFDAQNKLSFMAHTITIIKNPRLLLKKNEASFGWPAKSFCS